MKREREFNDILDKCLERIIQGETVEQCLASYPEHAAELEPLLRTALVTQRAVAIEPRPEFKAKARYQFRMKLAELEAKKERRFFGWQPRWATVVITMLIILVAGSSTVAAAGNSMPDQLLYPVKLATEAAALQLTSSRLAKAELYAKLADKRVKEIVVMASRDKVEEVERTAERLNDHLEKLSKLSGTPRQPPMTAPAAAPAPTIAPTPTPVPAPTPSPAPLSPPVQTPREAQKTPKAEVAKPSTEPAKSGDVAATDKAKREDKEDKLKEEERAKLKQIIARYADNPEILRAMLKTVPPSVKPALRKAIEVADKGYKEALDKLD